jgi:hypothetical protein
MAPDAAGAYPEIALGHFGVVALALAALVLRPGSRRRPAGLALAAPLVLGAAAATGTWPVAELAALVPALSRMFPLRYLTWVAFAGAALAACELDRLFEDLRSRRGAAVWPLAAWAGVAGLAAAISFRGAPAGLLAPERHAPLLAAAAAAAACAVFAATVLPRGGLRAAAVPLLTVVAGAELARQGTRLCRWSDPALLYPETPLVRFLRHAPGPFRIAGSGAALYPNVGVFAGVEDVRTHDPVERRDYVEFLDAVCGYPPREYFKRLADPGCGALAFLNVRYLAAPPESAPPAPRWTPVYTGPDGSLFADATARPRVFAPETVRVVRRPAAGILREPATVAYGVPYRELLRGLDLRREAVALDDGKNAFAPSVGPAEVSGYREGVNGATFRARTDPKGRGALLVTSLVDDGGWRARRETGEPVPSGRANGPFLALQAPPGDHAIRLSYAPPGFRAGVSVSAATAAAAAVVLVARRRRGSRPRLEAAA